MNRELIMQTLFERLTSPPLVFNFTADLTEGDVLLRSVVDTEPLLIGMPISGPGLQDGTVLATLEPDITLSKAPTFGGTTVSLTQGIVTKTRNLVPIGEIQNLPALCLIEGHESYPSASSGNPRAASNMPQMITLEPFAWLYARSPDPTTTPNSIINAMLDAIDKVMLPTDGRSWQNLGLRGVHHARIEGRSLRSPGVNGDVSARLQFGIMVIQGVETTPL
jgi:hypothetical protein